MSIISALHSDTNVGFELSFPTITTIPYSLFKTVPCATVCPPEFIFAFVVPAGKYALIAASQFASHPVGVGVGAGKYVIESLYILLVILIDAILHIETASSNVPCALAN